MVAPPRIAIIILHYTGIQDTLECLSSIHKISYPHFHVIIVNNSKDPCIEIKTAYPHVTWLDSGENLGFAEGNNRGIAHALSTGADYLFLLNNDTIVDPGILDAFLLAAKQEKEAVLGAHIFFYDDPAELWYAGGEVDLATARCYHKTHALPHITPTSYVCGCALFLPAKIVRAAGVMDPRFFLLWEEVDWCYRLRAEGYPSHVVPSAKVWHKVSRSFEGGNRGPLWQYYYWRNRLLFFEKHSAKKSLFQLYKRLFFKELCTFAFRSFWAPLEERTKYRAALRGMRDYALRRFGARK